MNPNIDDEEKKKEKIFLDFDEFISLHDISYYSLQSRSSSTEWIKRLLHQTLQYVPNILRMKKAIKPFLKQYYHKTDFETLKIWVNYLNSEMNRLHSVVCLIYNYYQEKKKRILSHKEPFVEPDYLITKYYKTFTSSS